MQELVHPGPGDPAPDHSKASSIGIPERGDIGDPVPLAGARHLGANAWDSPYMQVKDGARQLLDRQDDQPVGLLHVGSELGEQLVR